MTKTKKTNAQPAEEKAKSEQPEPEKTATAKAPEPQAAVPALIEVPKIDPEMAKMAQKWGIPLDKIVQMAENINLFFADYVQFKGEVMKELPNLPQRTIDLLKEEAAKQQQAAMQRIQQGGGALPQGGGLFEQLLASIAQQALTGGGGDSKLQELAMKSLEADISLSHTIKNAVSTRILAPITKEIADAASP